MRKLIIVAGLLLTATLSGCKKDKDDKPSNYVKYNGGQFEISQVYLLPDESESPLTDYYHLLLASPSIKISDRTGKIGGFGEYLTFDLTTPRGEGIEGRTFSYAHDKSGFDAPNTILDGDLDKIPEGDEEATGIKEFEGGNLSVNKSGSEYTISVQGKDENGKDITSYYKGAITLFFPSYN